jgi:hypothetical protein
MVSAEEHRHHAGNADHQKPARGPGKDGVQSRQQKDAGFYHGCRMQIGADRCRGGHGMREPEMERELCRFGKGPQQNQKRMVILSAGVANQVAAVQHLIEVVGPDGLADEDKAAQQRQSAGTRDRQGHARPFAGVFAMVPVSNQQERTDAGQFPEKPKQQQIVGEHDADHGCHEQQ